MNKKEKSSDSGNKALWEKGRRKVCIYMVGVKGIIIILLGLNEGSPGQATDAS